MSTVLFVLLLLSAGMILFGHFIMYVIDRFWVYPRRLAKVQSKEQVCPPTHIRPDKLPPAIVSQLVYFGGHNKVAGKSYTRFTVTLLDLIHRQKVFVTRREDELFFSPLGDVSDLLPFEQTLMDFIKEAAGQKLFISLSDLLVYIEGHKESAAEMRSRFLLQVSEEFLSHEFCDEISYEKTLHPLMYIGQISVAGTVGVTLGWLAGNVPLGLISVGLAMVAVALCAQVFRYKLCYLTKKGVEIQCQWKAYGAYLEKLTPRYCAGISNATICSFAVYAVALEQEKTFTALAPVWQDIAEDHPECILYDMRFFKKLTQIDNSILISNASRQNPKDIQQVIKKGHG